MKTQHTALYLGKSIKIYDTKEGKTTKDNVFIVSILKVQKLVST